MCKTEHTKSSAHSSLRKFMKGKQGEAEDRTHKTDETYTAELIYDLARGSNREG